MRWFYSIRTVLVRQIMLLVVTWQKDAATWIWGQAGADKASQARNSCHELTIVFSSWDHVSNPITSCKDHPIRGRQICDVYICGCSYRSSRLYETVCTQHWTELRAAMRTSGIRRVYAKRRHGSGWRRLYRNVLHAKLLLGELQVLSGQISEYIWWDNCCFWWDTSRTN